MQLMLASRVQLIGQRLLNNELPTFELLNFPSSPATLVKLHLGRALWEVMWISKVFGCNSLYFLASGNVKYAVVLYSEFYCSEILSIMKFHTLMAKSVLYDNHSCLQWVQEQLRNKTIICGAWYLRLFHGLDNIHIFYGLCIASSFSVIWIFKRLKYDSFAPRNFLCAGKSEQRLAASQFIITLDLLRSLSSSTWI